MTFDRKVVLESPDGKLVTLDSLTTTRLDQKRLIKRNHDTGSLRLLPEAMTSDIVREIKENDAKEEAERIRCVGALSDEERLRARRVERTCPPGRGVYVLKSTTGLYKIGRTVDLKRRMSDYWSSIPEDVTLFAFAQTIDDRPSERFLHYKFKDKRVKGEWFTLSESDVVSLLEEYCFTLINKPIGNFLEESLLRK